MINQVQHRCFCLNCLRVFTESGRLEAEKTSLVEGGMDRN